MFTRQSSSRRQIDVWIFTVFEEPAHWDSQNVSTLPWTCRFWDTLGMGSATTRHQAQAASAPELLTARLARLA